MSLNVERLRGALARGYCHDKNRAKELDSDLLAAIEEEVLKEFADPGPAAALSAGKETP